MEPSYAMIPARSRQQALDWSLVLVSQGIESTIEQSPENGRWQLAVERNDCKRAIQTIRQYKLENRETVWRPSVHWGGFVFDWRSVGWILFLVAVFAVGQTRHPELTTAGMMDRHAVWGGQWWRLFTAVTLHRDLPHLASNATSGILLLGLAMGGFGSGIGLLAAYLAGVGGNLAGLLFYAGEHHSLGASGMIFGALGVLSGQMLGLRAGSAAKREIAIRSLASGFLLLVLFGLNPASDVLAHVGGFVSGTLLGAALAVWGSRLCESALANRLAELLCALSVVVTWTLALAR